MTAREGPVALVGSGEYLPVMDAIERALLAGRPPRMVQLATAAAPEGPDRLAWWHDLGRRAAARLGVEQVVVPVVDRASADDPENAALVGGAGLIYLSGGNPPFLAATLRGSRVWTAIETSWRTGAALAGCSAGAMAMTRHVPDIRHPLRAPERGLNIVPQLRVIPHFDRFARRMPTKALRRLAAPTAGVTVLGIDEETALVGGPDEWEVQGRRSVWELTSGRRIEHPAGSRLHLPPVPAVVD